MIENRAILEIGERQTGKTTRLLKESARTGSHILVRDKTTASHLYYNAKGMGLTLPNIVVYDVPRKKMFYFTENKTSTEIKKDDTDIHLLIDEADCLFYYLFNNTFGEKKIDRLVCCTEFFDEIQTNLKPLTPYKLDHLAGKTEKKDEKKMMPSTIETRIPIDAIRVDNTTARLIISSMVGLDEEDMNTYVSTITILVKRAYSYIYGELHPEEMFKEMPCILHDGMHVDVIIYDQNKNPVDVLTIKYSDMSISVISLNKKVDRIIIEGKICLEKKGD